MSISPPSVYIAGISRYRWKKVRVSESTISIHSLFCLRQLIVVFQMQIYVLLLGTSWFAALQASLSFSISQSLLRFLSIVSVMLSSHLILFHPLPFSHQPFPASESFPNKSSLHIRLPKYWSFHFSISPSNECSGLISFRTDWFDLFAVQGILKSLIQHHSLKASVLQHSAFFMVQLSHQYMATGKTMLTIQTFVGKVMF